MNFDELNSNPNIQDNSNFDTSYNDDYDFIQDYETMMAEIEEQEPMDLLPSYDDNVDFYEAIDNWDNVYYEEDMTEKIAGRGKRSYNKLKENEDEYKKEFAEELTMLNELLDEVNKFSKKLDNKFDSIDKSKAKGTSKYLNDLIASILTSKTTKLQILKEMSGLKKSIIDLRIKAEGKKSGEGGNGSLESSANSYFREIMKVGRNSFLDALSSDPDTTISSSEYSDNADIEYINSLPEAHNEIQNRISERLESEGTTRSDEANKYIAYENLKVDLAIKLNALDNEWKVIAIDKHGQEVLDYPVPTRAELGKVKFSSDNKYASDKFGRSYKVLEVYS